MEDSTLAIAGGDENPRVLLPDETGDEREPLPPAARGDDEPELEAPEKPFGLIEFGGL